MPYRDFIVKAGYTFTSGSSRLTPDFRKPRVVYVFEIDCTLKTVVSVTTCFVVTSATPKPFDQITASPATMATAAPGTWSRCMASSMRGASDSISDP
jgi:hypothetical protein